MEIQYDPAAGHAPTHQFIPGQGYVRPQSPAVQGTGTDLEQQHNLNGELWDESEEQYQDSLDGDELDEEDYASYNPGDFTKTYNRQRRVQEVNSDPNAPKASFPKSNPQKPTANTLAR